MIVIIGISNGRELAVKKLIESGLPLLLVEAENYVNFGRLFDYRIIINPRDPKNYNSIKKEMNRFNENIKIKAIISLDELSVIPATKLANEFNLPTNSNDVANILRDKHLLREKLDNNNIEMPKFCLITNKKELEIFYNEMNRPFILKPVDSGGSAGVTLVNNHEEVISGFDYSWSATKVNKLIAEEYIFGKEYSVEALVINSQVYILGITEKYIYENTFIEQGHIFPANISKNQEKEINTLLKKILAIIGVTSGAIHFEIIINKGKIFVVEIGGRVGGDYIADLIELATGQDFYKAVLSNALGENSRQYLEKYKNQVAGVFFLMSNQKLLNFEKEISQEVVDCYIVPHCRRVGSSPKSSGDRGGYVIFKAESYEKVKSLMQRYINL